MSELVTQERLEQAVPAPIRAGYRKSDLIKEIALGLGMSQAAVERVLDRLAEIAYREAGRGFVIPGIGKIKVVCRKPSRHRNPITGQLFLIGERRVVKMVPLKRAKEAIAPNRDVVVQRIEEPIVPSQPGAAGSGVPAAAAAGEVPAISVLPAPAPVSSSPIAPTEGLAAGQLTVPCPECGAMVAFSGELTDSNVECPNCHAVLLRAEESQKPAVSSEASGGAASEEGDGGDYILFRCRACSQEIEAPRDMIGMTIECPACGSALKIPSRFKMPVSPPGSAGGPSSSTTMRIDLSDLE